MTHGYLGAKTEEAARPPAEPHAGHRPTNIPPVTQLPSPARMKKSCDTRPQKSKLRPSHQRKVLSTFSSYWTQRSQKSSLCRHRVPSQTAAPQGTQLHESLNGRSDRTLGSLECQFLKPSAWKSDSSASGKEWALEDAPQKHLLSFRTYGFPPMLLFLKVACMCCP